MEETKIREGSNLPSLLGFCRYKKLIQVGFAYVIKYMKSFANPRNLKTFREATVSNEKLWRASPNLLVSNGKILLTGRQSEH